MDRTYFGVGMNDLGDFTVVMSRNQVERLLELFKATPGWENECIPLEVVLANPDDLEPA